MQTELTPADRIILWTSAAFFVVISVATVLVTPSPELATNSIPSTYFFTPGGARAAFLLLQKMGVKVERWQEPPMRLTGFASNATLILAEPTQMPSRPERRALEQFVVNGGRVLFCGADLPSFFRGVQLRRAKPEIPSLLDQMEVTPLPLEQYSPTSTPPAPQTIELRANAFWQQFGGSQVPIFGGAHNAVVAAWTIGRGEIIWWAGARPLTNEGLQQADNLPLFLHSVGLQPGRQIYWDEYFHGEGGSLWDYAGRVPAVRWGAIQCALLACAALFTFSRRSGPVISPSRSSRSSPLEFVDTLGGLYRRAKAAPVAVEVPYRQLRLQLTRRLGLALTAPNEVLAQTAADRLQWDPKEIRNVLDGAEKAASAASFSPSAALPLVQAMQRFAATLRKN